MNKSEIHWNFKGQFFFFKTLIAQLSQPILSHYVQPIFTCKQKKKKKESKSQPFAVDNRNQSEPIKATVKTKQEELKEGRAEQMITSRLNLESKNCCLPLLAFGSNYTHITRVGVTLQSSTCAKMQFLPLVQHGKEKNTFGNCFKVMNMTSYKNKVLQFWFNIVQRGLLNILFRNEDY